MNEHSLLALYIFGTIIITVFAVGFIILVVTQKQKHARYKAEKMNVEFKHQQELFKTRLEVQEDSMTIISEELHDNAGQLLSLSQMYLQTAFKLTEDKELLHLLEQSHQHISAALTDIRNISHSLNGERISQIGLVAAIDHELEVIETATGIRCWMDLSGEAYPLNPEQSLLIFRIFQETIQNVIKHAVAKKLVVTLSYLPEEYKMEIVDDGKGFDVNEVVQKGTLGIRNIYHRLRLLNATASLLSSENRGARLTFSVPVKK